MNTYRIDNYDEAFLQTFRESSGIPHLARLTNSGLENTLLQRRFLSLAFTPFYDIAIGGLEDEEAKQVARELIREEYPRNAPSHREDLAADLLRIGLTKERILSSRPTPQTLQTIEGLFGLVSFYDRNYDIKVLGALKFAGELLVVEEYKAIVAELQKRDILRPQDSKFYVLHMEHDDEHSNRFNRILNRLIRTYKQLEIYTQSAERACDVKARFYRQFV